MSPGYVVQRSSWNVCFLGWGCCTEIFLEIAWGITVTLVPVFGKCVAPRDVREQDPAQGPAIDPAKHLNNESMQTNTNMSFRSCGRRM